MKTATIALAILMSGAAINEASAQDRHHHRHTYSEKHCKFCIKLYETTHPEKREVRRTEQVLVGYSDETVYTDVVVGYEDVVTGCEDVTVGYQDVVVEKTI